MKITKAQQTDSKRLTELSIKSKAYWNYSVEQLNEWREDLTISVEYINKHEVYLLVRSELLIGYYSFYLLNKKTISLDNLFVAPEYIGQGYGKILMEHFLNKIQNLNFKKVTLCSEPKAELFYAKFGFKVIDKLATSINNRFLPVMELEIKKSP